MASKAKVPKGGWQRSHWFAEGEPEGMVMDGFCMKHKSFWCPCAAPGLYEKKDYSRSYARATEPAGESLTMDERALSKSAAEARVARRSGSSGRWGQQKSSSHLELERNSIAAEILAQRMLYGTVWEDTAVPDHEGDIAPGVQVRHTKYPNGHLTLHPEDEDDHRFILVTGERGVYILRGWTFGHEGKDQRWWSELQRGRPAFNVPQRALRSMDPWQA